MGALFSCSCSCCVYLCGIWDVEYRKLRDMSTLLIFTGFVGVVFATVAVSIFPFQPTIVSASLCLAASCLTIVAALTTLCCCSMSPGGAHNAALMCMVIQLLSTASLLYASSGTSFDLCAVTKDCYHNNAALPSGEPTTLKCWKGNPAPTIFRNDVPTRPKCDPKYSYFCLDREAKKPIPYYDPDSAAGAPALGTFDIEYNFVGRKNCEPKWGDCGDLSKHHPQVFWGFDDREDCMAFYEDQDKIWPLTSTALVASGATIQIVFSFLFMYHCVHATNH